MFLMLSHSIIVLSVIFYVFFELVFVCSFYERFNLLVFRLLNCVNIVSFTLSILLTVLQSLFLCVLYLTSSLHSFLFSIVFSLYCSVFRSFSVLSSALHVLGYSSS